MAAPQNNGTDMVQDGSVNVKGRPVNRSTTGGWKSSIFILGVELGERIAYYGITSNLIIYMTSIMHKGLASATKSTNDWQGVSLVVPFIGGFFADAYWGRYWTIVFSAIVYLLGLAFMTLSVSLHSLKPPPCITPTLICPEDSPHRSGFFFFSLYLVAIGTGGIKPCLEAFGADQFDEGHVKEIKKKISFFNWWYFALCTGALFAVTVLVYIDDNVSWTLGFGIPAGVMAISLATFLCGTPLYRHKLPGGSPLTSILQVFVAALRKRDLPLPPNEEMLYENHDAESIRVGRRQLPHTKRLSFLDKAAILDGHNVIEAQRISPWKLCTVTQVEEVKLVIRIVPVWLTTFAYGLVYAVTTTLFTKQGATMERKLGTHFHIPPASFASMTTIVILILLPLYDRIFVPIARKITGNQRGITMLQRIGTGFFLSILSMIAAALTEKRRIQVAKNHALLDTPKETIPLTIFWLSPQYIIIGIADIFTLVGMQEFFYDQMPDTMKSLGLALYLGSTGVGIFINSLLVTIVNTLSNKNGHRAWINDNINRGHLDDFYFLLAILSVLNLVFFIWMTSLYKYKRARSSVAVAPSSSPYLASAYELEEMHKDMQYPNAPPAFTQFSSAPSAQLLQAPPTPLPGAAPAPSPPPSRSACGPVSSPGSPS